MHISSLLINFLLFWGIGLLLQKKRTPGRQPSPWWTVFFKSISLISLFWLLFASLSYLVTPLFFDHAESNIASVAAVWLRGGSMYTPLDSTERYSLLYGPWPYLVAAGFESFGSATILLSKVPGVLNCLIVLLGTFWMAKSRGLNTQQRLIAVGIIAMSLLGYYHFSYWNRPDSYLMAYAFLGVVALELLRKSKQGYWVYVILGILSGLAISCKVHGFLYFVPLAAYYLESRKEGLKILGLLLAAIFVIAFSFGPFLVPHVNLEAYREWLQMAAKHGLLLRELVKNISFISSFLIFLAALGFSRQYLKTFVVLCVSCLAVAVFASKPGAGTHHFIPFVPMILWWAMQSYLETDIAFKGRSSIVVGAFLMMLGLNAVNHQKRVVDLLSETPRRLKEFADLKQVLQKTSGNVELGYTTINQYESSFYKPWMVAHGYGLLLDGAAMMDMAASGLEIPESTIAKIKSCEIAYMVFPKGQEPWSLPNLYDQKRKLFSEDFRTVFAANYQLVEQSDFYQLWKCKKGN